MKARLTSLTVCMLGILLIISACSNTANPNNGGNVPGEAAAPAPTEATTTDYPRTVASADGELTITEKPKKVALVHWGLSDDLLIFDLPSIALALPFTVDQSSLNTEAYKPYADNFDEIVYVGENTTVNLEALLEYEPDLIIAGTATNKEITNELSQIAPTLFIDEEQTDVWGDWPAVVTLLGEVLGQEDNAQKYISDYDAKVEQAKQQLTGVEGTVAFVQVREKAVWIQGVEYSSHYYEALGLQAPEGATDDGAQLSLEGLVQLDPDHLFLGYFNFTDTSLPALTDEWEQSEVWKKLKAVQQNQVYAINGSLAYAFGPIARSYGLDEIVKALK